MPRRRGAGTQAAADVGVKTSNEWTLIQHFANDSKCLVSSADLYANLWHRTKGGREWYYLYRFEDPDPDKVQRNANGLLGFDATTICSYDRVFAEDSKGKPTVDLTELYYAGQFDGDGLKWTTARRVTCTATMPLAPRP